MTIDLSSLDVAEKSENPIEIELVHPATKEPLGQFISIIGRESKTAQSYLRVKNAEATKKAILNARKSRVPQMPSPEETEAQAIDFLVLVTKGFRNVNYNGDFPFTPENAKKLYTEQPWIANQVDTAMADLSLFFTD